MVDTAPNANLSPGTAATVTLQPYWQAYFEQLQPDSTWKTLQTFWPVSNAHPVTVTPVGDGQYRFRVRQSATWTNATVAEIPFTVGAPAMVPIADTFAPESFWNDDVTGAPLHPNSAAVVASLCSYNGSRPGDIAYLSAFSFTASHWTANASTPRIKVTFSRGGWTKPPPWWGTVADAFPLPEGAVPAVGTDGAISVYDQDSDTFYGLWKFRKDDAGNYLASWGGIIRNSSTVQPIYGGGQGVSASGLATEPGMVLVDDIKAGVIDHALGVTLPNPSYGHCWPANRHDGNNPNSLVKEGQRFRLSASYDVDAATNLHPVAKLIAKAMQKHGIVITERNLDKVALGVERGETTVGQDPDFWKVALGSTAQYLVLRNLPWHLMEALPEGYNQQA